MRGAIAAHADPPPPSPPPRPFCPNGRRRSSLCCAAPLCGCVVAAYLRVSVDVERMHRLVQQVDVQRFAEVKQRLHRGSAPTDNRRGGGRGEDGGRGEVARCSSSALSLWSNSSADALRSVSASRQRRVARWMGSCAVSDACCYVRACGWRCDTVWSGEQRRHDRARPNNAPTTDERNSPTTVPARSQ